MTMQRNEASTPPPNRVSGGQGQPIAPLAMRELAVTQTSSAAGSPHRGDSSAARRVAEAASAEPMTRLPAGGRYSSNLQIAVGWP